MKIISINHGRLHTGIHTWKSGLCFLGKELDSIPNPVLALLLTIFTPGWIHVHSVPSTYSGLAVFYIHNSTYFVCTFLVEYAWPETIIIPCTVVPNLEFWKPSLPLYQYVSVCTRSIPVYVRISVCITIRLWWFDLQGKKIIKKKTDTKTPCYWYSNNEWWAHSLSCLLVRLVQVLHAPLSSFITMDCVDIHYSVNTMQYAYAVWLWQLTRPRQHRVSQPRIQKSRIVSLPVCVCIARCVPLPFTRVSLAECRVINTITY